MDADALTNYEQERLERIRQNQERMRQLDLVTLAANVAPPAPVIKPVAKHRGLTAKRQRLSAGANPRRSSRILGEEADGIEIDYEGRSGGIVLINRKSSRDLTSVSNYYDKFVPQPVAARKSRFPEEQELPAQSLAVNPADDQAFLTTLANSANILHASSSSSFTKLTKGKAATTAAARKHQAKGKSNKLTIATTTTSTAVPNMNGVLELKLGETEIAKMTKQAITHMSFMPVNDRLVLAASDKRGGLGLWNVDFNAAEHAAALAGLSEREPREHQKINSPSPAPGAVFLDKKEKKKKQKKNLEEDEEEDSEAFDGVLTFSGIHYEYISGLKWAGKSSLPSLFSCSYDGTIRCLDIQRGIFDLAWADKEMEYSCFDVTADGHTAYIGDKDGGMDIVDLRSRKKVLSIDAIHDKKVNTVHLDPFGSFTMVTSSTDARVRLWDVRKISKKIKAVSTAQHMKTCQAAYLAPDGSQRVVSTSFDDTVRIWDGKKDLTQIMSIKHNNQTGRWILPMRAVWAPKGDGIIVGSMKHPIEVFNAESGKKEGQLYNQELTTAIAPRVCVHPTLPAVAAGTGSGRAYVYRS
jgi:WD40 repeat protein